MVSVHSLAAVKVDLGEPCLCAGEPEGKLCRSERASGNIAGKAFSKSGLGLIGTLSGHLP